MTAPTDTITTTAAFLEAAADLIEREGWTKGVSSRYAEDNKTVLGRCALGALESVRKSLQAQYEVDSLDYRYFAMLHVHAARALKDEIGVPLIGEWNDAEGRTAEEVVATMRTAAEHHTARLAEAEKKFGGKA